MYSIPMPVSYTYIYSYTYVKNNDFWLPNYNNFVSLCDITIILDGTCHIMRFSWILHEETKERAPSQLFTRT